MPTPKSHLFIVSHSDFPTKYSIVVHESEGSNDSRYLNNRRGYTHYYYRGVPSEYPQIKERINKRLSARYPTELNYYGVLTFEATLPQILECVRDEFQRLRYTCNCEEICKCIPEDKRI